MKYRHYFLLALIMTLACSGCKKVLDRQPLDFLTTDKYYDTEEKLTSNLAGVYDVLGHSALYRNRMLYRMGLEADEGFYARESPVNGPQVYNFSSGHADVEQYWVSLYTGVTRANALLDNLDVNPEIDQQVRNRIKGEALFLRAYYFFILVQKYGGVPLVLTSIKDVADVNFARASVKEVYDQILNDMQEAEELVPGIRTVGHSGQISKSAVRGMLARVCLHMAGFPLQDKTKYAEARAWAKKVIDDAEAGHGLISEFSQVFINYAQNTYDIKESIWEVEFHGNSSNAYSESGGVGYLNGPRAVTALTEIGEGFGGVGVTANLYNSYTEGDLRKYWTIANFTYNATTGAKVFLPIDPAVVQGSIYARLSGKYRREYETLLPKARTETPQNFPLLRFADVLLMFAEADSEINGTPSAEAVESVNMVRRRAWSTGLRSINVESPGNNYTTVPTVTVSGGGGTGVSAVAVLTNRQVTAINFLANDAVTGFSNGTGYNSVPTINISGGGGTGATATAAIFRKSDAELTAEQIEDFKKTIQDERLRELSFETLRHGDLVRWGIFVQNMHAVATHMSANAPTTPYLMRYRNVTDRYLMWPIPAREMNLNKALIQNQKW